MISTQKFLSSPHFFSHLSSAPVCALQRPSGIPSWSSMWSSIDCSVDIWFNPISSMGCTRSICSGMLEHPFLLLWTWCSLCYFSLFFCFVLVWFFAPLAPPLPIYCFPIFLKHLSPETPPSWLMVSAVLCTGSILEQAGTGCVWYGAAPDILSQSPSLQPTLLKPWYLHQI